MKRPRVLTTIALAVGVASSILPLIAAADIAAKNTIVMQSASVQAPDVLDGHSTPAIATVSFVNRGTVAATDVVFLLRAERAREMTIDDKGTFSPGVTIRHRFQDWEIPGDATISVAAVRYADGTSWTSSDEPALLERRQARAGE